MPKINDAKNNSTVALLIINGKEFWGVNKATAGISTSLQKDLREVLKDDFGKSAHSAVLTHAEVDAMIDACNKNMNAFSAEMYVDRKLCGFCAGQYFNGGSLRRLLPLLNLEILKVYTPDQDGYIKEVTLKHNLTFVSNRFD